MNGLCEIRRQTCEGGRRARQVTFMERRPPTFALWLGRDFRAAAPASAGGLCGTLPLPQGPDTSVANAFTSTKAIAAAFGFVNTTRNREVVTG